MVEFGSKEAAIAAKNSLHGSNIYPNMCTLRTEFTDKETLQVSVLRSRIILKKQGAVLRYPVRLQSH
jgi:hypothetical protein